MEERKWTFPRYKTYQFKNNLKQPGPYLLFLFGVIMAPFLSFSQSPTMQYIDWKIYKDSIETYRLKFDKGVMPINDTLELATYIALTYYPEIQENRIKIKYKSSVKYPITASWPFWNIFKGKNKQVYVLLLSENSFVKSQDLNRQVGVIGHEMAHFKYYKRHSVFNMIPWGIRYIFSRKFRINFEKEADLTTIEHGLGWQLAPVVFYLTRQEVLEHMQNSGYQFESE